MADFVLGLNAGLMGWLVAYGLSRVIITIRAFFR